ncbi:hypothetical protein BJ944DRAFT_238563 [Cunninghamella echinulata]|nr:hypothetical protein BJ944DRAFT_238563 [Cunninghamella echinulata]
MNELELKNCIYEILFNNIEEQIKRIVDLVHVQFITNNKKRKLATDNTKKETVHCKITEELDDQTVLYEVNILLENLHLIKQWYLRIIPTNSEIELNKETTNEEYLYCKVIQKGVQNSEMHAIKILDFIQLYHTQQLELSTTIQEKKNDQEFIQLVNTLHVTDTVFKIKLKYLFSEIVNLYIIFWDIAKKLYKLKSPH